VLKSIVFRRFAALAEILTILILGNVIGLSVYQTIVPANVADGTASPAMLAFFEGLLILLRIGSAAVCGFALLYYRRGLTPREAGLTRNNQPLGSLVKTGLALGIFTTIPIGLLFAARALMPFGEGLPAWWTYPETEIDTAFWIGLLATSVLIPPLTEEIFTRGYQRTRLVESYGVMGGVVLTGLVFAISHTRYLRADPMLLLFLLTIMISSVSWTYLAQKTGSVIPPMVAHAVTNGTATAILFDVWIPLFFLMIMGAILFRPISRTVAEFIGDWRADTEKSSLWYGLIGIVIVIVPGLVLLPRFGRIPTLVGIGAVLIVFVLANVIMEKREDR
jgi:membrane protease YdiL (CAAX protease family)